MDELTETPPTAEELKEERLTLDIIRVLEHSGVLRPMGEGERLGLMDNILAGVYDARYHVALAA